MPRGKYHRRALVARQREESRKFSVDLVFNSANPTSSKCPGTGKRHTPPKWPKSAVSGKSHKLVLPPESPNKKFVLLVGDSHLRSYADNFVLIEDDDLSFGVMSSPGASAAHIRQEVAHTALPRTPDAVCLLAPGNNLTSSRTVEEAQRDFASLLVTVCRFTNNVVVVDFPPRLTLDAELHRHFRQAYHRESAKQSIKYFSLEHALPRTNRELWAHDGVHLSDNEGMPVLSEVIKLALHSVLATTAPMPPAAPPTSPLPPRMPQRKQRVVVRGEVTPPRSPVNPADWIHVPRGNKRDQPGGQQQAALEASAIPTTPNRFAPLLDLVVDAPPACLPPNPTVPKRTKGTRVARPRRVASSHSRLLQQQVEEVPKAVQVSSRRSPRSPPKASSTQKVEVVAVPLDASKDDVGATQSAVDGTVHGERDSLHPCVCLDQLPVALVSGTHVREAYSACDGNKLTISSVVAAVRHVVKPVCTWTKTDVDEITTEGSKLASARKRSSSPVGAAGWTERLSVFGRKWTVRMGGQTTQQFESSYDTGSLYEDIQLALLTHGMCLMDLDGAVSTIIHHNDYFVMMDCGTCDPSGMPSWTGRSVAVFNTNLNDLMFHVRGVIQTLAPRGYTIHSITAEERAERRKVDSQVPAVMEEGRSSTDVKQVTSVRGTFHQGDVRFRYSGSQCMAISLVAMAKHKMSSLFSWQSENVDAAVVAGDQLYTTLREEGAISSNSGFLMVTELPKEFVVDGQNFALEHKDADDSLGEIDMVAGPLIANGVYCTLESGLEKVFRDNTTCFLTLEESTCAIIRQDERYAIFDSHARGVDGMIDANGFSVVLYFSSIQNVCEHIREFAAGLPEPAELPGPAKQFEIAGVKVINKCPVGQSEKAVDLCGNSGQKFTSSASCQGGLKHPLSPQSGPSKRVRTEEEEAVFLVSEVTVQKHQFNPLRKDVAAKLCSRLNVESEKLEAASNIVGEVGLPHHNDRIVGDGNCFFRAVSQAVSGTQKYHRKIRLEVVKLLATNAREYTSLLRSQYSSMNEYLELSRMRFVGSWATELEIQATADYLGVNVFTCSESGWLEFRCHRKLLSNQAIYLENCNGNHYETVVCVRRPQMQGCYNYCKDNVTSKVYNLRQQSAEDTSVSSTGRSGASCVVEPVTDGHLSNYLKRKRFLHRQNSNKQNELVRQKERERLKMKYLKNNLYRDIVKKKKSLAYRENAIFRDKAKVKSIDKYSFDVLHRERVKDLSKRKYALDTAHRIQLKDRRRLKYQGDEVHRLKKINRSKLKYHLADDVYRLKLKARSQVKYHLDKVHRLKKINRSKLKYHLADDVYRLKLKARSQVKYHLDRVHRLKKINRSKLKYHLADDVYRLKLKARSQVKYHSDRVHRLKKINRSKLKYLADDVHRLKLKARSQVRSQVKYHLDAVHRQVVRSKSIKKYRCDLEQKKKVLACNRQSRELKKTVNQFEKVMEKFLDKVKDGPDFVCSVCHRLLFRHQVVQCKRECYRDTNKKAEVAGRCISEEYLHKCTEVCEVPCLWLGSARGQLWICYTCHQKLSKGQMPAESAVNKLVPDPIPHELACLNSLEQHLIALHIPFMKMLALPKGGQNGVHGPVTCVPANIVQTNNLLPRSNMEGSLLPVKLKRKLTYKGHYKYQFVDTMRIRQALQYLKDNNSYYRDIEFNEEWLNTFCKEENIEEVVDCGKVEGEDEVEDELLHDRQQHCMFQDTCLMPVDIGQETLDHYLDTILNVAPAEGNNPVSLLSDQANEAKCFPVLFPQGLNTYHESRSYQLSLSRYFNNRVLNADGRFAQNVEYIFYAQYLSELQQVVSKVSIALRKGGSKSHTIPKDMLSDEKALKELFQRDDGYRFLTPIRGTPAFWQGVQRDLMACVRQLGIPTWFCSFSSADLRWKNLLTSILIQEGRTETAEQLEWADRCDLLRRHPVTAARMFDFRWHCFLREVLMSPSQPIGKIVDFFYRVEFQQRGSPHVHCLFWIENAPIIDKNTDAEVIEFIDKYASCQLPLEDQDLLDTVTSVQQHSKRHSKSCKKGGSTCRFNFPRPPSCRTFISRVQVCKCEPGKRCKCRMDKSIAEGILFKVKQALADETLSFGSLEELFGSLGISQTLYEEAYLRLARKTEVVLERQVNETWINQYSKPLLKCWNANMDVQFVTDAHAVVVYIIKYISKGEIEGSLMLRNAEKEASKEKNVSARDAMKRLGSVYLHNRDVSAQEAVYRLTQGLHLKECSRKVVFVPTGDNIIRMSLPVSVLRQRAEMEGFTADNMWMTSLVDRYRNRPDSDIFNDMCMATFASEYRILSKNETSENSIALMNNHGFIAKRTRTDPAVVRYARFSQTKKPELFHQGILQLFLPYRVDAQLKPPGFETYEQFYKHGSVGLGDESTHTVKSVVDDHRSRFEIEAEDLEEIMNAVDDKELLENAWAQLCPEQEVERLECREEGRVDAGQLLTEPVEHIPDLAVTEQQVAHIERTNNMCRSDGLALIRSLNETQLSVFYQIRQWCLDKTAGKKPDPFHVFITGGAGTGKSHLIRAIQYEATRLLAVMGHSPDNVSVVLTAPTGIAAYNLHAATIHNTLSIGKDIRLPYTPLGEERLNVLRAKFLDLQILIVDEISMVDHKMLVYIHGRLRQIKQSGDFSPFGNVSVIAVGDFYQLPPVKGKPLYVDGPGLNLWRSLFTVVELTTIVRQKDVVFAELLHRIRTRSKDMKMSDSDLQILRRCETGEVSSALHIFATNKQVNEHNLTELFKTCPEYVDIQAQDYRNNTKSGKLEKLAGHHPNASNTSLPESLLLGKDARVMLCHNIDVLDGLVNGVCGTVTHIVPSDTRSFPLMVYVKFDDDVIGKEWRRNNPNVPEGLIGSTGIKPHEQSATRKGGLRRQFPLKLAWACTIHKVQGITVDRAVVCLESIFSGGQAYVALSRVRTLSGLIIQGFEEKAIYCRGDLKTVIWSMPKFLKDARSLQIQGQTFSVFLMNVQSLRAHVSDLALCTQHLQPNCIAVTETWLPCTSSDVVDIAGYRFLNCARGLAYSTDNPALEALRAQQHGGVGMYTVENMASDVIQVPLLNLECLVYSFCTYGLLVAVVYRPPSYPMSLFKEHLGKLLDWLEPLSDNIAIMGDFNDDILKKSNICSFFSEKGFEQLVTEPTTEAGTLIDHVYVKTSQYEVKAIVWPTYFSDHEGVVCSFRSIV